MDFESKAVSEVATLSFDFSALMASIDTATVTITRSGGHADASPNGVLSGGCQISGQKVLQLVTGGVDGTRYRLEARAVKGAETFTVVGYLPVINSRFDIS